MLLLLLHGIAMKPRQWW